MPQTSSTLQGNVPAGYVVNQVTLTANPNGEGTYRMVGPQGQTVQVPFSKVRVAEDSHFQLVGDPSDSETDAGRYQKDAAAVAPSRLHSLERSLGVSIPQLKADELEREQHPIKNLLEVGVGGPAYGLAKGLVQQGQQSYGDLRDAVKEYRGGNTSAAIVDAVHAVPVLGPGMTTAAEEAPVSTGSYRKDLLHVIASPSMGTLVGSSVQGTLLLDGLQTGMRIAARAGLPVTGVGAGSTSPAAEAGGASAATPSLDMPPTDASSVMEGEGATAATPSAEAAAVTGPTGEDPDDNGKDDDGPGGGGASAAVPPVDGGSASASGETASAPPPVDGSRAAPAVDAAAASAPAGRTAFSSAFSQTMDSLRESELGQRAPGVLQDGVQAVFEKHPNFKLVTPDGIVEVPPGQFFTQPSEIQEALRPIVLDPTTGETLGQEQGTDGVGLAKSSDAAATATPQTAATPGNQGTAADTPASTFPATSAPAPNGPTTNTFSTNNPAANTPAAGNANVSANSASTAGANPPGIPTIDVGKQAKHTPAGYQQGRVPESGHSILTVDPADLVEYAGKGQPMNAYARGTPGFKERVDFGKVIGDFVEPGQPPVPTTKFAIVYAKNNMVHIYPLRP